MRQTPELVHEGVESLLPRERAIHADGLHEITELRDAGVLTDEEFQRAKKKLLG
jgi:Short C-terminal domain